jgi:hypothetical protein
MLAAGPAELFHFYLIILPLTAGEVIILVLAVRAGDNDGNSFSH